MRISDWSSDVFSSDLTSSIKQRYYALSSSRCRKTWSSCGLRSNACPQARRATFRPPHQPNKILQHKQLRNALSRANSLDVRLRSPFSTCAVSGRIAHWRHCLPDTPMHNDLDQVAASPSSKDSISVTTPGTDRPVMRNRLALRHMVKLNAAQSTIGRAHV